MSTPYRHRRPQPCLSCSRVKRHKSRGLCDPCWYRNWTAGTLDDFPLQVIPRAVLLEDWRFLASQGYTRAQAAERMGIKKARLEKAIERERRHQEQQRPGVAA